jgi:hypothetical protein
MAKSKVVDKNHPKSLTSAQRMFVDQLQTRFGERFANVKRTELVKASQELLKNSTVPGWISRNLKVRNKEKRGMYNLSSLLKLPIVAFDEPKKAKKKSTPKAPKAPKAPKVKPVDETPVVVDTEAALAAVKAPAKKKVKKPAKKEVEKVSDPWIENAATAAAEVVTEDAAKVSENPFEETD